MRLLYVSGTYAPGAHAGSELSAHTLLRGLVRDHGVAVLVVTDERYTAGPGGVDEFEGVRLSGIGHGERAEGLSRVVADFAPDLILTQPWWHELAIRLGNERGIPTVLRAPDGDAVDEVSRGRVRPTAVVTATEEGRDLAEAAGCDAVLLPAFIDLERAVSRRPKDRRFITMFNPIRAKGGFMFREIARRMAERSFAVIPGWASLRDQEGKFDRQIIARAFDSSGEDYNGWIPEEPDFTGVANVTVLEPRQDVSEIYDQTWALLVPSQWKEQFGRVVLEAAANGAPVIASGMASLRKNMGDAAMYVDPYQDVDKWIAAIRTLDDPRAYTARCEAGRRFVSHHYSLEDAVTRFYDLASRLARRPD